MLSILEQWFMQISNKPLQTILSICKQPFPDLKCAALYVIGAIANQEWAQRLLNQHGGFHEYLLDRSTEHEQTGKQAKYYVIKTLAESVTTTQFFGRPFMLKLIEYVKDGPLFRIVQSEVALEMWIYRQCKLPHINSINVRLAAINKVKRTISSRSEYTFNRAWNWCPSLSWHSDWKLLSHLCSSNCNMTLSCGIFSVMDII